jgi:threonylcarbamoyladenosine tRNA methylthiotransferase MtaB
LTNTKVVLADLPVSYYHVFNYSDRKGTASDLIKQKVDPGLKKKWIRMFIEQGNRKKRAYYERFLGKEEEVLFEQKNKEQNWTGYTSNYMSIELNDSNDLKNTIKKVKLTAIKNGTITGTLKV